MTESPRTPWVTILLAIHNGADTLDCCLESLDRQTLQDFRILAVDDRSTDTTSSILERWQGRFGSERFAILKNETNLGLTRSLNRGLAKIDTPYTARIDADDWWEPEKLEKQLAYLESHPECGVLGTAYVNVTYGKEVIVRPPLEDAAIKATMFKRNPFAHSAVCFRTALIREAGGYDNQVRYGQDYELWLRLAPRTSFANLGEVLCHRRSDSGISYRKQSAQMRQCVRTQIRYLRRYRRPLWEYAYILDPLLMALSPSFIREWKRKWL